MFQPGNIVLMMATARPSISLPIPAIALPFATDRGGFADPSRK
jgi:hypothetical protein